MYTMIMIIVYMKSALQTFLYSGVFTLDEIIYNYMDEFAEDFNSYWNCNKSYSYCDNWRILGWVW